MNKTTLIILLILTLILTGCNGNAANAAAPASNVQNESAAELSVPMQVAIGMMKLDGTDHAVTAEQASELLPLWQTLQVLYGSDTAATEEIDA